MIYLASPYSHPDPQVRASRYSSVLPVLAALAHKRISVYSPIVHWYNVEIHCGMDLTAHDLWKWSDCDMMNLCTDGLFLKIDGWKTSRGMEHEEQFLRNLAKPVAWVYPEEIYSFLEDRKVCGPSVSSPR